MKPERSADRLSQVRRRDREVSDETWMAAFLERAAAGVLATALGEQPFAHPNLFVYDGDRRAIYFHTAAAGRTRATVESNPRACFTVWEMGRLLPASTALEFSVEYASVVAFGRVSIVTDADEARHGLQMLLDKYFPHLRSGSDYRPIQAAELDRTAVYRLDVEEWSGKQKQVAGDPPGAFRFGERDQGPP